MPVITKRQVNLPAQSDVRSVPQLTVETTAPSAPVSTNTEVEQPVDSGCCECDIPLYYNPFLPLFNFLWILLLVILAAVVIIVLLNVTFFSFLGLTLLILPKYRRCKKCGKIFRCTKKNEDRCPYCGALIEDEIKPH